MLSHELWYTQGKNAIGRREDHDDDPKAVAAARSDDDGATWNHKVIEDGSYSYSTVGAINKVQYVTLYSIRESTRCAVGCRVFNDKWLEA